MKDAKIIKNVTVDCEQCLTEVTVEDVGPGEEVPENWIEIHEGPPFNNSYQFCSPECFLGWRQRDKYERLQEYHTRKRARDEARRPVYGT